MNKRIIVTWLDHYRYDNNSWLSEDEIDNKLICECETMGFLIKETKDAYCIAETRRIRSDDHVYSGVMVVAKKLVTKKRLIK